MERSRKLLVAMQGKGVFVVDLETEKFVSGLNDCIVVAASPGHEGCFLAGTERGVYKSTDGGSRPRAGCFS